MGYRIFILHLPQTLYSLLIKRELLLLNSWKYIKRNNKIVNTFFKMQTNTWLGNKKQFIYKIDQKRATKRQRLIHNQKKKHTLVGRKATNTQFSLLECFKLTVNSYFLNLIIYINQFFSTYCIIFCILFLLVIWALTSSTHIFFENNEIHIDVFNT